MVLALKPPACKCNSHSSKTSGVSWFSAYLGEAAGPVNTKNFSTDSAYVLSVSGLVRPRRTDLS